MPDSDRRMHPALICDLLSLQKGRKNPIRQRICYCEDCSKSGLVFNHLLGKLVPGKYCGEAEYQKHQRRLDPHPVHIFSPSSTIERTQTSPQSRSCEVPGAAGPIRENTLLSSPHSSGRHDSQHVAGSKVRSFQDRADRYRLTDIQQELDRYRRLVRDIDVQKLIFSHSPSTVQDFTTLPERSTEPNSGPFALADHYTHNEILLEFDRWISRAILEVRSLPSQTRPSVCALHKTVTQLLQKESCRVYEIKAREWHRRHKLARRGMDLLRGTGGIIETCE